MPEELRTIPIVSHIHELKDAQVALLCLPREMTQGTARDLLDAGASPPITVAATHGLFVKGAREMMAHESLQNIFVTDTIAPSIRDWPQLKVVSIAPLIAGALRRFISNGSISDLF